MVGLDLDLGCGNLNTCLGVRSPGPTINDFIFNRISSLTSATSSTELSNLFVVSGAFDSLSNGNLTDGWKNRLLDAIGQLHYSFALMDLAAGASQDVLDFFLAARERIVVVVPESLSMQNAFVFIKSAIIRLLEQELGRVSYLEPVRDKLQEIVSHEEIIDLKTLIDRLKEWDRFAGYMVRGIIDDLRIKIVINMYRGGKEKKYLERFHNLLLRNLYLRNFEYIGVIHFGKKVHQTVQSVRPFMLTHPNDSVSRDIRELAARLANQVEDPEPRLRFPDSAWLASLKRARVARK